MIYVYKIMSKHKGVRKKKIYIGATTDMEQRIKAHRASERYRGVSSFEVDVLHTTPKLPDALMLEWKEIDAALGGVKEDGNREHFEGQCLNRSPVATLPLSKTQSLCYTQSRLFYIRGS